MKLLTPSTNGIEMKARKPVYNGKPVTQTLTNGFFAVDQNWTVKYWNKAAEKILHVTSGDIVGKNLWEKFIAIIPVEFYAIYDKAFLQDIPVHFNEYWREMGAWFDVVTYYSNKTLFVSFKSSDHPNGEYPVNTTDRLETLTELYRYVTEITNDCLWEWDLVNGELFWIDGGHKRVFGYPIENSLVSQSFWESRIHRDDRPAVTNAVKKMLQATTGELWEIEYRFRRANGEYAHIHDRGHIIYEKDKPVRMIGATQDITEKVMLVRKMEAEAYAKQREISQAVFIAQEKERGEIGRELHDNLNQVLAVAKMYIQMARQSETNWDANLEKSIKYIDSTISAIRRISKTLVLPPAHIIGLMDNIRNLLKDLEKINPIRIDFFEYSIDEATLDEKLQVNIFRIIQEQVNNILTHSKATHASIHLRRQNDKIALLISDNGKGCPDTASVKGVGIFNIRSRAELFNGTVSIISDPGEGFALKVILQNPAAAAATN